MTPSLYVYFLWLAIDGLIRAFAAYRTPAHAGAHRKDRETSTEGPPSKAPRPAARIVYFDRHRRERA